MTAPPATPALISSFAASYLAGADARQPLASPLCGDLRDLPPHGARTRESRKMLAQTLRDLESDGLVHRRVEPTAPPAVHYSLTPLGETLVGPLDVLREWAEAHMHVIDAHRTTSVPTVTPNDVGRQP